MRILYTWKDRDPERVNKTMTHYGYASVMMPISLAGSQLGAVFLAAAPSIIIQIILFALLTFLFLVALQKARSIAKAEQTKQLHVSTDAHLIESIRNLSVSLKQSAKLKRS